MSKVEGRISEAAVRKAYTANATNNTIVAAGKKVYVHWIHISQGSSTPAAMRITLGNAGGSVELSATLLSTEGSKTFTFDAPAIFTNGLEAVSVVCQANANINVGYTIKS